MPRILQATLYELACIGRDALASLPPPSRSLIDRGLTRCSFLYDQIEAAATLPIADKALAWTRLSSKRRRSRRSAYFSVPGFCYARLFEDKWMIPAICTLGPYPDNKDMSRLSAYFRPTADQYIAYDSGVRRRHKKVYHVMGISDSRLHACIPPGHIDDRLRALRSGLVGAAPPNNPDNFPSLPRTDAGPSRRPPPSDNRPRGPPPPPRFYVPPGVRRSNRTPPLRSAPTGVSRGRGRGGPPQGRDQSHSSAPYHVPQSSRPGPRRSSPDTHIELRNAIRDPWDDLMAQLKGSLSSVPSSTADCIWQDFLSWMSRYQARPTFSRLTCLPVMKSKFREILDTTLTSVREAEEAQQALAIASDNLAKAVKRHSKLEALAKDAGDNPLSPDLAADLEAAREAVQTLSREVESMEDADVPPPGSDAGDGDKDAPLPAAPAPLDPSDPQPPAPAEAQPTKRVPLPWNESNYKNFYSRSADAFPSVSGKFDISDLLITIDAPLDSKILLPGPLELYSTKELKEATGKGIRQWLNRYEDPLEPLKCHSTDAFKTLYSQPGFRFLIARVAQRDAQWKDKKMDKLRAALSSRWKTPVTFEKIAPRHDWLLCTIPEVPSADDPVNEIFSTALIRLSDGNACYVVRHLAPMSTLRDVEVTIKGSLADPISVYHQLTKKQLSHEASGTFLGWRVFSVRPSRGVSKYRVTALLESNKVSWPWSHGWDHPHGSLNSHHNLLDFMPHWDAVKPPACQSCYNSDHMTLECPLAHIRLGGIPVVSAQSLSLVLNKRPAERMVKADKPEVPLFTPHNPILDDDEPTGASNIQEESPARPLDPDTARLIEQLSKFMSVKLHTLMPTFPGLTLELVKSLCSLHLGDLHMVAANLHSRGYEIPFTIQTLEDEWQSFQRSSNPPGTPMLSEHGRTAPPPRYFQLVRFINDLLLPVMPLGPGINIPEIVHSCRGDIETVMRRLEVVHGIPVPPASAQALTNMFSNWLAAPHQAITIDDPLAPPPTPHRLRLPLNTDHISVLEGAHNAPVTRSPLIRIPDVAIRVQPPAGLLSPRPTALAALPQAPADIPAALPPAPAVVTAAPHHAPAPTPLVSEQITRVSPFAPSTPLPAAEQPAQPAPMDYASGMTNNAHNAPDSPYTHFCTDNSLTRMRLGISSEHSLEFAIARMEKTPAPPNAPRIIGTNPMPPSGAFTPSSPAPLAASQATERGFASFEPTGLTPFMVPALTPVPSGLTPFLAPLDTPARSDTQVLSYALTSPEARVLAPEPLTELTASLQSVPIDSWPSSAPTDQDSAALRALCSEFPTIGDELVWRIFRKAGKDIIKSSAELVTLRDVTRAAEVLHSAFPAATPDDIATCLDQNGGDIFGAYMHFNAIYESAWDPSLTPGRLLTSKNLPLCPSGDEAPTFVASNPEEIRADQEWWESIIDSKSIRAAGIHNIPGIIDDWVPVVQRGYPCIQLTPRIRGTIWRLCLKASDPNDYADSLNELRILPSFHHIASYAITNNRFSATVAILSILLEEGMINPGAAAWLALAGESHPNIYQHTKRLFSTFPSRYRDLWHARNQALHTFRSTHLLRAPATPSRAPAPPDAGTNTDTAWGDSVLAGPSDSASILSALHADADSEDTAMRDAPVAADTTSRVSGKKKAPTPALSGSAEPYDTNDPGRRVNKARNPPPPTWNPDRPFEYVGKTYQSIATAKGAATKALNRHHKDLRDNARPTSAKSKRKLQSLLSTKRAVLDAMASVEETIFPDIPPKQSVTITNAPSDTE